MAKCPYCGRTLIKHESFCYHCEQDVRDAVAKSEKIEMPRPKGYDIRKDARAYSETVKRIIGKFKKGKKAPEISAYCVKCKKKVNIKDPKEYTMKNNKAAVKGICPYCSAKVFRISGNKK